MVITVVPISIVQVELSVSTLDKKLAVTIKNMFGHNLYQVPTQVINYMERIMEAVICTMLDQQ